MISFSFEGFYSCKNDNALVNLVPIATIKGPFSMECTRCSQNINLIPIDTVPFSNTIRGPFSIQFFRCDYSDGGGVGGGRPQAESRSCSHAERAGGYPLVVVKNKMSGDSLPFFG